MSFGTIALLGGFSGLGGGPFTEWDIMAAAGSAWCW